MAATLEAAEVIAATSEQDAVSAFGDGEGVTVIAGGTIAVPDMTHGRLRPGKALLLANAGLAGVRSKGGRTTIGAMTCSTSPSSPSTGASQANSASPRVSR